MKYIINELTSMANLFDKTNNTDVVKLLSESKNKNIIGLGAGRMGYSLRAFIMRLGHLGYNARMIGDTCIPPVDQNCLILVNSSSGETKSILQLCQIAKEYNATLVSFTSNSSSSIARISDYNILVPKIDSEQPMKTISEQFTYLMFDCFANNLAKLLKINIENLHTNLGKDEFSTFNYMCGSAESKP